MYDDIVVVEQNNLLRSNAGLQKIWAGHIDQDQLMNGTYRPVFMSFLSLAGRSVSFQPWFLKLLTLFLHSLTATLLIYFLSEILGISKILSTFATLFFLLHPIQTTNMALVWKQTDVWIAFLTLLSLLVFFQRPWVAFLCFLIGLGIKESALIIPFFWVLFEPFAPKKSGIKKRAAWVLSALAISFLYYTRLLIRVPVSGIEDIANPTTSFQYFFTQLSVLPMYFKAFAFPSLLTIDRNISIVLTPSPLRLVLLIFISFTFLSLAYFSFRRRSKVALLFLFGFAWLIPTSTFKPLALFYDETRMYLAIGFFSAALILMIQKNLPIPPLRTTLARGILSMLALFLMGSTFLQATNWKSEKALWQSALEVDPTSVRAHYFFGTKAQDEMLLDEAESEYQKALRSDPSFPPAILNLGIVLGRKGKLDAARDRFISLLDKGPYWAAKGNYHLGLHAMYQNQDEVARKYFERADQLFPSLHLGQKGEALLAAKKAKHLEGGGNLR